MQPNTDSAETLTPIIPAKEASLTIDCDEDPKIINDWKVVEHQKNGKKLEWNPDLVELYRAASQEGLPARSIKGDYLQKEVLKLDVCNANVLDSLEEFFEKNPHLIPESFRPKLAGNDISQANIFWGTIYQNGSGKKFVRSLLCYKYGPCIAAYVPVDHGFSGSSPAVIWK